MPMHWTKHLEEGVVEISDFQGGINVSVPRTAIQDNECEWIENLYFDPTDGRLTTRWPVDKYSNSAAVASTAVTGIYYWNSTWFLVCNATLYYLDSSLDPQSIGALNSSSIPTFLPFNDQLLIATGNGTLEAVNTSKVLSDVTNAPKGQFLLQKDSAVVLSGDPDNKDRIAQSEPFDETDWSGGASNYADVGFKDKMSIIGIHEAFDGLYIVFKRGDDALRTYFLTSISETAPVCRNVSDTHCAISHHSIVDAASRVFFAEERAITALQGVDAQGKMVVDPNVGLKLSSIIDNATTCHAVVYPPDKQIWFIPDTGLNRAYIYHYLKNSWTSFSFGSRKVCSAFYRPSDEKLYLGMDDGYIYIYNINDYSFQDDGSTDYTQWIKTKVFDVPPHRNKVIKKPMLFYEGLADGTAAFCIKKDFGKTLKYEGSLTVDSSATRLYDTQSIYIYDTQAGETNEMYLYDERSSTELEVFDVKVDVDNFQFTLNVTSGAVRLEGIVAQVGLAQEKK